MRRPAGLLLAAVVACAPLAAAEAHRSWLLPSATVLSGDDLWVTVDAARSNDLFYFDHNAMPVDNLVVTAPDGSAAAAENANKGRYRSTFDVPLRQKGTYRIAVIDDRVVASYTVDGQQKRWRGTAATFASAGLAGAEALRVTAAHHRIEVFVTNGKPSTDALKPTNSGLEMVPVTHPNDLVAGETARFRLLLDGKPAAGVKVTVIPGGIRYRDRLEQETLDTDDAGTFAVTWKHPGMFWLSASVLDENSAVPGARRRAAYTTTLEVMPE